MTQLARQHAYDDAAGNKTGRIQIRRCANKCVAILLRHKRHATRKRAGAHTDAQSMDDVGNSSTKRGNTRNWKTPNAATHQKHKR